MLLRRPAYILALIFLSLGIALMVAGVRIAKFAGIPVVVIRKPPES